MRMSGWLTRGEAPSGCNPSLFLRLLRGQFLIGGVLWLAICLFSLVRVILPGGCFDMDILNFSMATVLVSEPRISSPDKMARDVSTVERFFVEGNVEFAHHISGYALAYQVYDQRGRLLIHSGGMPVGIPAKAPEGSLLMDPRMDPDCGKECLENYGMVSGWFYDLRDSGSGKRWRAFVVRDPVRGLIVRVGEPIGMRWLRVLHMIGGVSASLAVVYVLLIVMTWFGMRRVLRPVTELAHSISGRPQGSLEPVSPLLVFQETAPLVDEINSLLDGTRQHLQEERGFLADAAHELRTPLAAVGMQAHALILANTQEGRSSALSELNAGLKRVSHLAQQLLTSARVDVRRTHASFRQENLAALARERAASLSLLAMQKSIELELHAPETLPVEIDRFGMGSVFDNLIDNAIRYTPEGGRIDIRLGRTNEGICLDVCDTGPGIPEAEREKVLQRFYRLPGNLVPGSGLGLSIVQRVVELHGGRLELGAGPEGLGLCVHVVLSEEPSRVSR